MFVAYAIDMITPLYALVSVLRNHRLVKYMLCASGSDGYAKGHKKVHWFVQRAPHLVQVLHVIFTLCGMGLQTCERGKQFLV
jgi:hypothetical protein